VDGLEHCLFRVADGIHADQRLIDRIAERQIIVCPTLGILPGSVSAEMMARAPMGRALEAFAAVLDRMHHAGVRRVAGTDAGIFPGKPHDVQPYCIRALADAGLSNGEALGAATSVAANACSVADRKGVLTVGGDADIVAVGGNPLADLAALHDVRAVFRAGVRVSSS